MRAWSLFGPRCALAIVAVASLPGSRCLRPADEAKAGRAAGVDALSYARTFSEEGLYNTTANELWDDLQNKVVNASLDSILRAHEYRALLRNFSGQMSSFVRGHTVLSKRVRATQEQKMKEIQKILGGGMHKASSGPYPGVTFGAASGSENGGSTPVNMTSTLQPPTAHKESSDANVPQDVNGTLKLRSTSSAPAKALRDLRVGPKGTLEFVSTSRELLEARPREEELQDELEGTLGTVSTTSLPEGAIEEDLDEPLQGASGSSTSLPENPNEDLDDLPSGTLASASSTSSPAEVSGEDLDDLPLGNALSIPSTTWQAQGSTTEDLDDKPQGSSNTRSDELEVFEAVRCAFQAKAIQCDEEGTRIQVLGAFWNRRHYKACEATQGQARPMVPTATCAPNATGEVVSKCNGQENCLLPADGGCPKDPFKAMRVSFKCA